MPGFSILKREQWESQWGNTQAKGITVAFTHHLQLTIGFKKINARKAT